MDTDKQKELLYALRDIEHARAICNDSQVALYLTRALGRINEMLGKVQ